MCNAEQNKELMRAFGLCAWPNKYINVIPHKRTLRFTEADAFNRFIAAEGNFDFDWELYLLFEAPPRDWVHPAPIAVVYATCVGRSYNPPAEPQVVNG